MLTDVQKARKAQIEAAFPEWHETDNDDPVLTLPELEFVDWMTGQLKQAQTDQDASEAVIAWIDSALDAKPELDARADREIHRALDNIYFRLRRAKEDIR